MTAKSRNKKSRREVRRRKQLKEIAERAKAARPEPREWKTPLRQRLSRYVFELALILFVVLGVLFVISLGPDKKAAKELKESFDAVLYIPSVRWNEAYTGGYKVFALKGEEIIETTYDTLPADFKTDWKKMAISRIQSSKLEGMIEQLEILIREIDFASLDVHGATVRAKIEPQKGASAVLANWKDKEFSVSIAEEDQGTLFLLLGLKNL